MLFDEDDASLLKKWIVKRLEDISDADSDVLADYVLALLRHDQAEEEVKQLCVDQLDDFLKEHTVQFVDDVFVALATKAFRSVNSTLTGGLSVHIPSRSDSPPMRDVSMSPREAPAGRRTHKRSYYDRDDTNYDDDSKYRSAYSRDRDRDRGAKMPRRGGGMPRGSWTGRGGLDIGSGRGAAPPMIGAPAPTAPGQPPVAALCGMPPIPPWMPPNPNDPMAAFLAAQAAAAWGFPPGAGVKLVDQKKVVKKVGERCKDYDEKGFCMKGDMCPYEHGVDPIVVPGQESKAEEYDPNNSMLFPLAAATERSTRGGRGSHRGRGGRGAWGGGRGGRAEFSMTGPSFDRSNPRLVVENIPEDKLTEAAIKEFFSTFGTIDNVEIHQHKHLAILTFSSWDMAKAAYDSPAPIFDNRFVKVFWHRPSDSTEASPTAAPARTYSTPQAAEEEKIDIEEIKRKQEELQKAHEEKMAKKKANEEAGKELKKRQEELMRLQAEEKRKLVEKLAKKQGSAAATAASSSTPTPGTASPSTTGTISANQAKPDDGTMALKAQLEALQAEARALGIDQNATEDSFDLDGFHGMGYRGRGRGRGRFPTRGYVPTYRGGYGTYRGRGTYAPRGGAPPIQSMRLDNRTKRVAVTVPDSKRDMEEEIKHYLLNNEIILEAVPVEPHPEKKNTLIFTFLDRRNAEKFVFMGNDIPDVGTVIMAWHNSPVTIKAPSTDASGDTHMAESDTPPPHNVKMEDDSYDLAEDDEGRWLPE